MTNQQTAEADLDAPATPAADPKPPATKASVYEASKEIVVRKDGAANLPMPTTFAQMQDFASTMARAGPMVGKPFRDNPGACLAILTQSMRWGMDPYAVSQKAYVAAANGDGPIGYEGQLVAAVVTSIAPLQKRLRCEYSGEGDDRQITVLGYLKGEDEAFPYTSPKLSKLKPSKNSSGYLKGSQLWDTDPDQQLWYYGVRAWARKWTPDVIMGVYTPDEMSEAIQRGRAEAGGEVFSLNEGAASAASEGGEGAKEAEFTPIDGLLNKANSPKPDKPAKEKAATGKGSGRKAASGDGGVPAKGADKEKPTPAPVEAASAAEPEPQQPDPPAVNYVAIEEIITRVEELAAQGKHLSAKKYVDPNRDDLVAVSTGDKPNLAERAKKVLEEYPAK